MNEKDKKNIRSNSDAAQNEQEQFADAFFESDNDNRCTRYPERKSTDLPAENDDAEYAFHWEPVDIDAPIDQRNQEKPKNSTWMHTLIMAISFIAAFGILCSIFIAAGRANSPVGTNDVNIPVDSTANNNAETKTVYVKEFDSSDGVMTPQEIYTHHSDSVVSISASNSTTQGIGSGFVITSSGYIATAQHVVAGMNDITVIFSNGDKYAAELVGSDELTDLALLKIAANGLETVEFGKSSDLIVGDELVAIGTPASLEFSGTMTRGDVSYTDRTVYIYDDQKGSLKTYSFRHSK